MIDTELSSIFKSCADAIRSKTGDLTTTYTPYELSSGINSIQTGSSGWSLKDYSAQNIVSSITDDDIYPNVVLPQYFIRGQTALKTICSNNIKGLTSNVIYDCPNVELLSCPNLTSFSPTNSSHGLTNLISADVGYSSPSLTLTYHKKLTNIWSKGTGIKLNFTQLEHKFDQIKVYYCPDSLSSTKLTASMEVPISQSHPEHTTLEIFDAGKSEWYSSDFANNVLMPSVGFTNIRRLSLYGPMGKSQSNFFPFYPYGTTISDIDNLRYDPQIRDIRWISRTDSLFTVPTTSTTPQYQNLLNLRHLKRMTFTTYNKTAYINGNFFLNYGYPSDKYTLPALTTVVIDADITAYYGDDVLRVLADAAPNARFYWRRQSLQDIVMPSMPAKISSRSYAIEDYPEVLEEIDLYD